MLGIQCSSGPTPVVMVAAHTGVTDGKAATQSPTYTPCSRMRAIAGAYGDARGPAHTFTPMSMLDVSLSAGGRLPVELPRAHNAMAVVVDGRVQAGGETARAGELLLFAHDGERLELIADEDSHVLILAGEPIEEPVVQYGPFVMNSLDEIRQAITDVNSGRFGPIPD